jgi:hypothetical protein
MLESPVTAAGLGCSEALALKLAPDFLHVTTCRQVHSPWQAADGALRPRPQQVVADPRCQGEIQMLHCASSFRLSDRADVTEGGNSFGRYS